MEATARQTAINITCDWQTTEILLLKSTRQGIVTGTSSRTVSANFFYMLDFSDVKTQQELFAALPSALTHGDKDLFIEQYTTIREQLMVYLGGYTNVER